MPIEHILGHIADYPDSPDADNLRTLVAALRPPRANQVEIATERIRALCHLLHTHPHYTTALRQYLIGVVTTRKVTHLFTDTGITLSTGFWSAGWQRLLFKLLPPLVNDDYMRDVFGTIFNRVDDHVWINGVAESVWFELIHAIGFPIRDAQLNPDGIFRELLSALQVLSYRISTIGLESELVRNHPSIEQYESPFLRQNDEMNEFVTEFSAWLHDRSLPHRDSQHIDVLLTQCEEIVIKIRRTAAIQGVSVSLTQLLLSVTQSITRVRKLLTLIEAPDEERVLRTGLDLFRELVFADNHKYSLADLARTHTDLITLQVTEHAGRSGEHYVANSRREWLAMLRSASGAGLIVGFMALIKILLAKLPLAPFGFAFLYSMNYALGFMLVHIIHCTIATKQPAMTAALIAKSLDQNKQNLDDLCELVVQVIRTQFIAIVGNVAIAMPTAYLIAMAWYGTTGADMIDAGKAQHLLHDINPIASLSLFHAAIAGVCLFLSGLLSGYYDNKASYNKIPERLLQLPGMNRLFGAQRWRHITEYIGNNLGALAGNFFFGVMLGSIGQIGVFLGLPVDIRHITFSSANFAFALVALNHQLSWQTWVISMAGIALIGITNLTVSFSLALYVAMRSRKVSFQQSRALLAMLGKRFIRRGREFFFPPEELT